MAQRKSVEEQEGIRARILSLIDSEFESDAAFEREMGLSDKTVNNWRRGRSSSFMKILPKLSASLGVNIGELLDMPLLHSTSELSEDELRLLTLYRRSRTMPKDLRIALRETLENIINLYMKSTTEIKNAARARHKREIERLMGSKGENEG